MATHAQTVDRLLEVAGQTYAEQAGIRLRDKPAPLYQLVVLATLLSTRINAGLAVDAVRELAKAGMRTPSKMRDATWQDRVDALGRAHYRRYDERTATQLGDGAVLVLERYSGDLRTLGRDDVSAKLQEFPGIGPTGADIFLREVQTVWPWLQPRIDDRVAKSAADLGLPTDAAGLTKLAGTDDLARLAAALVHVSLDRKLRAQL